MKFKLITSFIASLLVVGSAMVAEIKKADKDSDGTLEKSEIKDKKFSKLSIILIQTLMAPLIPKS